MDVYQAPEVSTDKTRLDPGQIQAMLKRTYWGQNRSISEIQTTIDNSRCYGLYLNGEMIGFARVLSDLVVFAYLMDVLIDQRYQGKGYSKILLDAVFNDPQYKNIQRWNLVTRDAHDLYRKFGFENPANPENFMEKMLVPWN